MAEPVKRSFVAPIVAVLTSPIVVVGSVLAISMFFLSSYQQNTNIQLRELAKVIADLNKGQSRILTTHKELLEAVSELEGKVKYQRNRLKAVDAFTKEKNVVVSGVLEKDGENLESEIRSLLSKRLSLIFGDLDLELVRRFGRKVSVKPGGDAARRIIVRFANYLDKVRVLKSATKLNGTNYSVSDDTRRLLTNSKA
ncbi:uncharacterized protein LOC144746156 [Ciona intestinalis]